jgi:hypothetical protein
MCGRFTVKATWAELVAHHRDIFMHVSRWVENEALRKGDRVTFVEDVGRDRRTFARDVSISARNLASLKYVLAVGRSGQSKPFTIRPSAGVIQ